MGPDAILRNRNQGASASANVAESKHKNADMEVEEEQEEEEEEGEEDEEEEYEDEEEEEGAPLVEQEMPSPPKKWSWDDDVNHDRNDLWHGRPYASKLSNSIHLSHISIHGVLSLCLGDLSWLPGYLKGIRFQSFTVVSKCGVRPKPKHLPKGAQVIEMENVGRIDHTIAHWMAQRVQSQDDHFHANGDDIFLFLKDNIMVHCDGVMRDITTVLKGTMIDGFGCALEPRAGKSFFHITDMLKTFNMEDYHGVLGVKNSPNDHPNVAEFKSKYRNMGAWLSDLNISLPLPLTPVCYGGNFAATRSSIEKVPHEIRLNLERSLRRGDSIEEGHFAERSWAGLLFRPITEEEVELLFQRTMSVAHLIDDMRGALMKG